MKKTYFSYLIVILLLASCSNEGDNTLESGLSIVDDFPQTWALVEVNTGLSGMILKGDALPYQENLTLNNDTTFTKILTNTTGTLRSQGTFALLTGDNGALLQLLHDNDNEVITNCSRSNEEFLRILDGVQLSGGALPCDGPGLLYERIK